MCETSYPDLSRDLLTMRGMGFFTVFRATRRCLFYFPAHWRRILDSCEKARISTSGLPELNAAEQMVLSILQESDHAEYAVRIIVTAGDTADSKHATGEPKMLILADPMPVVGCDPLRLALQYGGRKRPEIKMVGPYADLMLDLADARKEHCQDVLYFSEDPVIGIRCITETTCGNVFFVTKDNRLITPSRQVLAGVTRSVVLELAGESKLFERVETTALCADRALSNCVEAFRTASISGIVPIRSIGDYQFKTGLGTRTEKIQQLYADYVDGYFPESEA